MIENLKTIANQLAQIRHDKSSLEENIGRHDALADMYEHSEQTDSMLAQRAEQYRLKGKMGAIEKEEQRLLAQQKQIEQRIEQLSAEITRLEADLTSKRDERAALQG